MNNPTTETYDFLTYIVRSINEKCFDGELPNVLLTIKGKGNVFGYYKPNAFVSHSSENADEIAVNPKYFATHGFKELLQTLAHEMCHQWQYCYGKPSRRAYHNNQFAEKMKSIGLIPSTTGKPGGAETGQSMADYMGESGPLVDLFNDFEMKGVYIPWYERIGSVMASQVEEGVPAEVVSTETESAKPPSTTRSRYTHQCKDESKPSVVYGKPNLPLMCGACNKSWDEDEKSA